jgi:hypothetical protein
VLLVECSRKRHIHKLAIMTKLIMLNARPPSAVFFIPIESGPKIKNQPFIEKKWINRIKIRFTCWGFLFKLLIASWEKIGVRNQLVARRTKKISDEESHLRFGWSMNAIDIQRKSTIDNTCRKRKHKMAFSETSFIAPNDKAQSRSLSASTAAPCSAVFHNLR